MEFKDKSLEELKAMSCGFDVDGITDEEYYANIKAFADKMVVLVKSKIESLKLPAGGNSCDWTDAIKNSSNKRQHELFSWLMDGTDYCGRPQSMMCQLHQKLEELDVSKPGEDTTEELVQLLEMCDYAAVDDFIYG